MGLAVSVENDLPGHRAALNIADLNRYDACREPRSPPNEKAEFASLLGAAAATRRPLHLRSTSRRGITAARLGLALSETRYYTDDVGGLDMTSSIARPGIESPIDRRSHSCMQFESFASPATPP